MTRDEVLEYYGWEVCTKGDDCCHDECRIPLQMADTIVHLREQLTQLQEFITKEMMTPKVEYAKQHLTNTTATTIVNE